LETLERLNAAYPSLFSKSDGDEGERTGGFVEEWGWFVTLDNLTDSDFTKWDTVTEWGVVRFLNTLTYFKQKQDYVEQQRQQAMLRNSG